MGCFADFGWAWNIKPSRSEVGQWQACIPSCEFAESFLIWLYGFMDVFMEHMAAWGSDWVAQDLEHVSISIMFFGGGLVGRPIFCQCTYSNLVNSAACSSKATRSDSG